MWCSKKCGLLSTLVLKRPWKVLWVGLAASAGDGEGESRERKPKMLSEEEAKGLKILQEARRGGGLNKTDQGSILARTRRSDTYERRGKGC